MALNNNKRAELRRFGRRETNYSGWIRVPGMASQLCVVRNMSLGGALLECEYPHLLPFRFLLDIPSTSTTYECEARHRRTNGIGVEFRSITMADVKSTAVTTLSFEPVAPDTELRQQSRRVIQTMRDTLRQPARK
ncbi:MAG: PilZ domain-containing protein [Hyphomicrobiaceae bacterium]